MTDLKTLKDLEEIWTPPSPSVKFLTPEFLYKCKLSRDLRAEAIKWVKALEHDREFEAAVVFKNFFNLSEDDLK